MAKNGVAACQGFDSTVKENWKRLRRANPSSPSITTNSSPITRRISVNISLNLLSPFLPSKETTRVDAFTIIGKLLRKITPLSSRLRLPFPVLIPAPSLRAPASTETSSSISLPSHSLNLHYYGRPIRKGTLGKTLLSGFSSEFFVQGHQS